MPLLLCLLEVLHMKQQDSVPPCCSVVTTLLPVCGVCVGLLIRLDVDLEPVCLTSGCLLALQLEEEDLFRKTWVWNSYYMAELVISGAGDNPADACVFDLRICW